MDLNSPVTILPHTSTVTVNKLHHLGLNTYEDVMNYFPFRYEDFSVVRDISRLTPGKVQTVTGTIRNAKQFITRSGLRIQQFNLEDANGSLLLVFYNQPYLMKVLRNGIHLSAAGIIEQEGLKFIMKPKEFEIITDLQDVHEKVHTGGIIPIYPTTAGLSLKTLREKILVIVRSVFSNNPDLEFLPKNIREEFLLIDESLAYRQIHRPDNFGLLHKAIERLSFDELFLILLSSSLIKEKWKRDTITIPLVLKKEFKSKIEKFITSLPFTLTTVQTKSIERIITDLQKKFPMNRLLQGDVGSGKTIVAFIACYFAYLNGFQSLFMCPTEILAEQHFRTLQSYHTPMHIGLLTASHKPDPASLQKTDLIIGTHALIQEQISFEHVSLVVIDEQHRFGVNQRAKLSKKGCHPHLLSMTATPIPRTVALTLYSELDLSVLDELPEGRKTIKTFFVPSHKRTSCYEWVRNQIARNQSQVFIVCPLIEESDSETMKSVKAVKKEYVRLTGIFPEFHIGLLHGKMSAKEKDKVMESFRKGSSQILLSTSVVEVGIDIPNARIIIIEGSDRYGLAQLHQLRGRVGRSSQQSYCYLFSDSDSDEVKQRLSFFSRNHIGSVLAEYDLIHRGAGNIFGTKQHGFVRLKIASLSNLDLIRKVKKGVQDFLCKYSVNEFPLMKTRLESVSPTTIESN